MQRQHWSPDGRVRTTVRTFKLCTAGLGYGHIAWGGEAVREEKRPKQASWLPWTWFGGAEWIPVGEPPEFTLTFKRENNVIVSPPNERYKEERSAGRLGKEAYMFWLGKQPNLAPLSDDLRHIRRVELTYSEPHTGEQITLWEE